MNNSFMVGLAFSLGFMIGSLFNLFIMKWFKKNIYHPKSEIETENLLKEIEKMMHQKEKEEFNNFEIQKKDIKENIE